MPLMKKTLMLSCMGSSLLLASCATQRSVPADSYCQVYMPVIQSRGDAAISAPLDVKKRILFNEKMYRAECRK